MAADAPALRSPSALLVGIGALAAAYFLAAKAGLSLAIVHASATAVWPPTGLALAALLLFGRRLWPGVFLGAFLANATTAGNLATSLAIGAGNTLEAVVAVTLVQRFAGGAQAFDRPATTARYFALAVLATTLSPTLGVTALALAGFASWSTYAPVWFTWWMGDAAGAAVITPALVLAARGRPRLSRRQAGEAAGVAGALLLAGGAVFLWAPQGFPLSFLCLPPLVWAAYRFGARGASGGIVLLTALALAGTLRFRGAFAVADPNSSLLLLQGFLAVATAMSLGLGTLVDERRRLEGQLRASSQDLERRVEERTEALQAMLTAMERSRGQLAQAERIASLGSWEWDIVRDQVVWSEELCRIYGVDPKDFHASYKTFLDHVHPQDRDRVDSEVRRALATRQPFRFEHRIRRTDGTEAWLLARGEVEVAPEGTLLRMHGTGQDLTDRRDAERQRRELERLREIDLFKTQFLNMAAHELSTPLTPIRLQVEILRNLGVSEPAQLQRSLDILERNVDRTAALVQDLLEAARLQAGRLTLRKAPVDLRLLAEEALESFEAPARRSGLQVELVRGPPLVVQADPQRLHQVFLNLLTNAWKFTPRGGRITLAVSQEGDDAVVRVTDTGVGLRAEHIPLLFQPFTQVGDTVAQGQGTGLGLFISKGILELHGGRIWCESDGPGKGSTFAFAVPMGSPQEASVPAAPVRAKGEA